MGVDTPSREPVTVFFGLVAVSGKLDRPFGPRNIEVHATLPTSSPLAANAYTGLELVHQAPIKLILIRRLRWALLARAAVLPARPAFTKMAL